MYERVITTFFVLVVHYYVITSVAENIGQLPHCVDNSGRGLIIVSTLDGKLSALNSSGGLVWQIETGPGPLLKSNIHNVELTNNGEWIRLIPSLTGGIYKFNGKTIDAIPVTADILLKSSFFYSHDLVIAGGKEVRTYGVGLHSGNIIYTCSLLGCQNETNFEDKIDSVLIIERNTLTVRAHEPRTGNERWNFSVGLHNIKVPNVNCIGIDNTIMTINISAVVPEGLLIATKIQNKDEVLWEYKFDVPIVNAWRWDGRDLLIVNIFDVPPVDDVRVSLSPDLYLAMHNKQLYIQESNKMSYQLQSILKLDEDILESRSVTSIPWKPISASNSVSETNDHHKSTAISVLYNSEYVNGNGFYLYADKEYENKEELLSTLRKDGAVSIDSNWPFIFFIITPFIIAVLSYRLMVGPKTLMLALKTPEQSTKTDDSKKSTNNIYFEIKGKFTSIYESNFDTISCLGEGGFGMVFESRQKVDECVYAVKRITLPNDHSEDQVLREVKALAKLEHKNIVRYYNSWFERPPLGWQYEYDKKWIEKNYNYIDDDLSDVSKAKHKEKDSTVIDMSSSEPNLPSRRSNSLSSIVSFRNSRTSYNSRSDNILIKLTKSDSDDLKSKSNGNIKTEQSCSNSSTNSCLNNSSRSQNKNVPVYLYIQMQLCKRESLKDWLFNNTDNRTKTVIIPIFKQILNAVEYIHSKALIHRDLKPTNIFFSMDNDIKVGDFGLVTPMNDENDDTNASFSLLQSHTKGAGTELYMSPEQLERKRYNFKVDIYSLGVILFELIVPFSTEMERHQMLINLRKHNYPDNFKINYPDEHCLLEKMLSNNPDIRPTTGDIKETPPFIPPY